MSDLLKYFIIIAIVAGIFIYSILLYLPGIGVYVMGVSIVLTLVAVIICLKHLMFDCGDPRDTVF